MSSHLPALQLAPCPPLIHNQCCLCISYDCALSSGAIPCSQEQTRCNPEDSTVIQAIIVLRSITVWASSFAGFIWSSGLFLKAETSIPLFPLMINKQLQRSAFCLFAFSNCKLRICFSVQGQLEEHMAVLTVQSCHSFCQVAVSSHVARQHWWKSPALPCLLLHCFQIKACLKGELSLQLPDLKKKKKRTLYPWVEKRWFICNKLFLPQPPQPHFPFSN